MAKTPDSCPYLGLAYDRAIHTDFPNDDHNCFAWEQPMPVSASRQRLVCLASPHATCWRLPDHERKRTSARALPGIHRGLRLLFAIGGTLVVLGIASTQWLASWQTIAPEARGSSAATATATPLRPTQTALPQATAASAQSTATLAPAATATQERSPTRAAPTSTTIPPPASPSAQPTPVIHVVTQGETLLVIATRNGVTVDAILRANGLTNPDQLSIGQRLIIPPSSR